MPTMTWQQVSDSKVLASPRHICGYGPTRFLSSATLRSGQQAAMGTDLLALLDALSIDRAVLAGYDWGGRAACVVAVLYPTRAVGLVSGNGYAIENLAAAMRPADPRRSG